ncbi:DUF5988 family protein [Streptomyces griseoluteus]|uniref:DUF5988 family protein n=1 Tax=Streptomyces TaxID=1883 RepID=UPI001FC905B9|nr:DUF5988 family protein [Streptomyces recifensis]
MWISAFINSLCRAFSAASRWTLPPVFPTPLTREQENGDHGDGRKTEPEAPNSVSVLLRGGPDWIQIPDVWHVRSLELEPKVKILCGNAYEHFEFSGLYSTHEGVEFPVYHWSCRTYVAE